MGAPLEMPSGPVVLLARELQDGKLIRDILFQLPDEFLDAACLVLDNCDKTRLTVICQDILRAGFYVGTTVVKDAAERGSNGVEVMQPRMLTVKEEVVQPPAR